jgi:hypothetical protein
MARMRVCSCTACPAHPGSCPELSTARHCTECASEYERRRGTRVQRGYGREHTRLRAQWKPKVERCEVKCARCDQLILPGQTWALDHTDDRTGYLGPSHATCNNQAGGRAARRT